MKVFLGLLVLSAIAGTASAQTPDAYAGIGDVVSLPAPFEYVEASGWEYVGLSADGHLAVLRQPARQRGRVWYRYESLNTDQGVRSSRALIEIDCAEWRTRTLDRSEFAAPNLRGPVVRNDQPMLWRFAAPGSIAESVLEYGCGD